MTDKDLTAPHVRKILDISTAHVSEATSWYLEEWAINGKGLAIVYEKGEYGWLVHVPGEPSHEVEDTFPADLRACMEHARSLDCDWIMFDRDGITIDALPSYEW